MGILTAVFFAKFQYGGSVQVEVVAEMVTQKSSIQMQTQIQILALLSLSTVDHLRDHPHRHSKSARQKEKDALMMPSAASASVSCLSVKAEFFSKKNMSEKGCFLWSNEMKYCLLHF